MSNSLVLHRKKGPRLSGDQQWSDVWAGHIVVGGGVFREPFQWRGKSVNRYKVERSCDSCGRLLLQNMSNSRRTKHAFCDASCKSTFVKANSYGSKTIKKRAHGDGHHILVRRPDHLRASKQGQVFEHILVAEEALGRSIKKSERVHHINCVKSDNRPENLFVCKSDKEHFLVHGSLNTCVAELLTIGVLAFDETKKLYFVVRS